MIPIRLAVRQRVRAALPSTHPHKPPPIPVSSRRRPVVLRIHRLLSVTDDMADASGRKCFISLHRVASSGGGGSGVALESYRRQRRRRCAVSERDPFVRRRRRCRAHHLVDCIAHADDARPVAVNDSISSCCCCCCCARTTAARCNSRRTWTAS